MSYTKDEYCICNDCNGCVTGWCEDCTPDLQEAGHALKCPCRAYDYYGRTASTEEDEDNSKE